MLGDKAEIAASVAQVNAPNPVDRPYAGRWATQAARARLKVAGSQLAHPVTNSNQAVRYTCHR